MLEKLTEGPQINEVVVVFPTRETTTSVAVKIMNVKEREKKKEALLFIVVLHCFICLFILRNYLMRITQRTVDIRYIFSIICEVFTDVFFFLLWLMMFVQFSEILLILVLWSRPFQLRRRQVEDQNYNNNGCPDHFFAAYSNC